MTAKNTYRFLLALVATSFKSSFALRKAFWLQVIFMTINNLLYFTIWWILFTRFETVRGWRIEDVMALFGIAAGGFGLAMTFAGGLWELSRSIFEGELDFAMTQPKSVLAQVLLTKSQPSGWGDIVTAIILLVLSGYVDQLTWPLSLLAMLLAAVIFVASGIVVHCTAFWLGRVDALARMICEFLLTFSIYPPTLFGFWMKLLLFTLLPAGFATYLPVQLLREPSWSTILMAFCGAIAYATLALFIFSRGLRRYASGSRFSIRI